ncbi:MAG: hypothetical protein AAGI44_15265, partial [Pseudomonadota bacterium]
TTARYGHSLKLAERLTPHTYGNLSIEDPIEFAIELGGRIPPYERFRLQQQLTWKTLTNRIESPSEMRKYIGRYVGTWAL